MRHSAIYILVALGVCGVVGRGQAPAPEFEVASIKPSADVRPMMVVGPELRNGRLRGENVTLRSLLAVAFGMTEPRVIGPEWLGDRRFEVIAESPDGFRTANFVRCFRPF